MINNNYSQDSVYHYISKITQDSIEFGNFCPQKNTTLDVKTGDKFIVFENYFYFLEVDKLPSYLLGNDSLRKSIYNVIDKHKIYSKKREYLNLGLLIDEQGNFIGCILLDNPKTSNSINQNDFVIYENFQLKGKWNPAKIKEKNVGCVFILPRISLNKSVVPSQVPVH